ncbi:MAG: RNA 3'-terminal phosphate cyclase [Archangium sp.]|nr:RNA 3'-terminal phosphate cyclase [Archangium sp.]MDP3151885.1 RNA 3'-terminal phosphate cyclase [Archangium sp.]MDP3571298.1 RNA 3'-terminal phosphate cyclase [Archangium sp.]
MMSDLVVLDGREGEGGGQVLRSALSLSMITGKPFRLEHVRAKRKPAGLKAQHLTCVTGAAAICDARTEGAELGSHTVEFHPGPVSTAPRVLDVGTAGSTPLLLQCLFYPLALAGGAHLTLRGGTHVTFSPSFDYVERVWMPMLRCYGLDATLHLDAAGFFPQGGGSIRVEIQGVQKRGDQALEFAPVKKLDRAEVLSIVGGLPFDIARRQNDSASARLARQRVRGDCEVVAPKVKHSKGSATLVWAKLENGLVAGESWLGDRGVSAEDVGRIAAEHFLQFVDSGGSCDVHLGDQLLMPAALAAAGFLGKPRSTTFTAAAVSEHLTTHVAVLQRFLPVAVSVVERVVRLAPAQG